MVEYMHALVAGAIAGTSVDTILFPLDTIKTRLQSKQGFLKSGGFKNIYSGLSSAIMGSSPSAAFFFLTYETSKKNPFTENKNINHMIAASMGEIVKQIN
jgi:solute carrier family 25 S-adenosylmethionine transporter 26